MRKLSGSIDLIGVWGYVEPWPIESMHNDIIKLIHTVLTRMHVLISPQEGIVCLTVSYVSNNELTENNSPTIGLAKDSYNQ